MIQLADQVVIPKVLIEVEKVSHIYPNKMQKGKSQLILNDISLEIERGDFITVVGPTGSGKSTLLKLILGSEKPTQGRVLIDGLEVEGPDVDRGFVPQYYTVFPHFTVEQNVMFGLESEHFSLLSKFTRPFFYSKRIRKFRELADHVLEEVGLLNDRGKYPYELSGGMRQRLAIAQAMVTEPKILLMDEPFGALDAQTREDMQVLILDRWRKDKQTIFLITHDLAEAVYLATVLIVISPFWSTDDGQRGQGSKIVEKISIDWPYPRSTSIKTSCEFRMLLSNIQLKGINPEHLQSISDYDLKQKVHWDNKIDRLVKE